MINAETATLNEMSRIYGMFCLPRIVVDTEKNEIVSFEGVWINGEAEECYNNLSEPWCRVHADNRKMEMRRIRYDSTQQSYSG